MAKMRGVSAMRNNLKKVVRDMKDAIPAALYAEAQIEATEMKKRTPVDTTANAPHPGQLRDSIHVEEPTRKGRFISVLIATGAHVRDYDIHVHENPDAFHPVGQWKYMESVLNESRKYMLDRIARRVRFK